MQKTIARVIIGCLCLVGIVVVIVLSIGKNEKRIPHQLAKSLSSELRTSILPEKPEVGSQWNYSSVVDGMGRKKTMALVASTNTLHFSFPYQGVQHGTLTLRKSAQWGTEAMVQIERGQFVCGIGDCAVSVRFDAGPIQRFVASGPSDHSTTTLFLHDAGRFISQVRKATIVRVEATFYHEGLQTLEFNAGGLKL